MHLYVQSNIEFELLYICHQLKSINHEKVQKTIFYLCIRINSTIIFLK